MAWNEPGKPGQDPWGNDKKPKNPQKDPSSRPNGSSDADLDELIKKAQRILGVRTGGGGSGPGGVGGKGIVIILAVVIVAWLISGFYTVDSPERGVVKRFGAYVEATQPGLHWHLPWPIESVTMVNVDRIRTAEIGYRSGMSNRSGNVPSESLMLTKDENIVDIKLAVQYKISDAEKYLYAVSDPDTTLRIATESALREVVGQNSMDFVLTEGRNEVVARVMKVTQKALDSYNAGLMLTSLNLQDAQPPEQVQSAFADAVKAREDRERLINEAEAYSNDILPKARGQAARQIEEARGYRDSVVAKATGETSRFNSILSEYKKAPKVTRERLYIEAVGNMLSSTSKVFVGADSGTNLLYLPLDKMMGQSSAHVPFTNAASSTVPSTIADPKNHQNTQSTNRSNIRDFLRNRELR